MGYKYSEEEEKRVETLTLDIIRKELLKNKLSELAATFTVLALVLLALWLTFSFFSKSILYDYSTMLDITMAICVTVFMIVNAFLVIRVLLAIRADKIKIVVAELSHSKTLIHHTRHTGTTYYLFFYRYGKYTIPRESYKWSKLFRMYDKNVYNSSNKGDNFYLALIGNKKIGIVYNCKLFKYEGQTDNQI